MLPHDHKIYSQFYHSFQIVTVSNLIKVLNNYGTCNRISVPADDVSFTEHFVQKFLLYRQAIKSGDLNFTGLHPALLFLSLGSKCTLTWQ